MKKNLIIFTIFIIGVFLLCGVVSASDGNTSLKEKVSSSTTKKFAVAKSTPTIIDKGTYRWTDSKNHKCWYTWKSYKYSAKYVVVKFNYAHQLTQYSGQMTLINKASLKYKNDIYATGTGNMWKNQWRGFIGTNEYASSYATRKTGLYQILRKGSLISYFKHPAATVLDKRDDWEVKSVTVKRLTIMYPTHEIYHGSFFDITINYGHYTRAYNPYLSGMNYIHLYLVKSTSVPLLTNYRKYPNVPKVYYPVLGSHMTYYEATNKQLTHKITFTCPVCYGSSSSSWTPPSGWYRVAAIIDRDGRDSEYDETNNVAFSAPFYYYTNPSNTGPYLSKIPK
jgi:hypothetical protein